MIKPEFFDDPVVGELSLAARLFFIGLWTEADSQGRLIADLRQLKVRIFPYDSIELRPLVDELEAKGVIKLYDAGAKHRAVWICNFRKHQRPHPKEPASLIPEYNATAVKINGEPLKETANPSESGSFNGILNTESGVRKFEAGNRTNGAHVSRQLTPIIGRNPHIQHAVCDPSLSYCVPSAVHHKLADLLAPKHAGDREAAKIALIAWYPTIWSTLPAGTVMGDAFKFWQGHFDAAFVTPAPKKKLSRLDAAVKQLRGGAQ